MNTLQILVPMGGLGTRYSKAGYTTPKPLIPVDGMPMFLKAASSLNSIPYEKKFTFVIRQEHVEQQHLDELIRAALPDAQIVVLKNDTAGAAETALAAQGVINPDYGLVIMDCDLWFNSSEYEEMVTSSLSGQYDISGGLLTFESTDPRYSYVLANKDGLAQRTAEKDPISNNAVTGAYFFTKASYFFDAAKELVSRPLSTDMPEYYLSLVYNILINDKKYAPIAVTHVDKYASFGTPEELARYEAC